MSKRRDFIERHKHLDYQTYSFVVNGYDEGVRHARENAALQETGWEYGRICCDNCRVIEPHAGSARFATHRRRKAGPWIPAPEGTEK